jgi:hypothetical protein
MTSSEAKSPAEQSFEILTAMWKEGIVMGALPPSDSCEAIAVDFRIVRILN